MNVDRTRPAGPYYTPLKEDGTPARFLKAKPLTDGARCAGCGLCSAVCPMGSISRSDFTQVTGVCIKCQACIRACPAGAKYFDDPDFLSHVTMLERTCTARKDNLFLEV
nr:4Fe-4S binding protein [Pseudoflavonifractor sp. 524-17]